MAFITFIIANAGVILTVVLAVLSLLTALFKKNEKATGIIAVVRSIVERLSALQPRNSEGTLKVPGKKAAPAVEPPIFG
ncbi:MAG TPA: hypothetical protein VMW58_01550 [Anaerolineae bacterium]|nr:hypothetical protein [Anaerolineae bacterium]